MRKRRSDARAAGAGKTKDPGTLALALEHHRAGRLDEAQSIYRRLLDIDAADADALHGLGIIALTRGDVANALDLIEEASERRPQSALFLSNLAAAYHDAHLVERARECAERAIQADPRFPSGYTNHGHALATLGRPALAEKSYRKALELEPSPLNRLNVGVMRLLNGDYHSGLPLYEARLEARAAAGDVAPALEKLRKVLRWRGESLQGRRILIWTEQGLGDTIMMLRYIRLLRERGAKHVAVCCEAALSRLVESAGIADEVFCDVAGDWSRRFDVHSPTMSLPLAFGTTLGTIPRPVRYLDVPEALRGAWADRASGLARPRVGLVWAGGRQTASDPYRSIPLEQFAPVLGVRGVSFVSLQQGPQASQLASIRRGPADWMGECHDLLDTAALIEALDLVISVDTAVAHLSAALGKPTWLVNRQSSEWRWLLEGSESPWYPTMRIFRQGGADWSGVIAEIAAALEKEFAAAPRRGLLGRLGAMFSGKKT